VAVRFDPEELPPAVRAFLAERHLATLTTLRADGSPHVVPVGFTWQASTGLVRIITGGRSRKMAHIRARGPDARVVLCQVDGRRWLSLEGRATVTDDTDRVAEAVRRYAARYQAPRPNPERVAVEVVVERVLGSVPG
jgi:PPOX class probable F420-dependent enzyme